MRLFYYKVTSNFGDHMNSWLWDELFPGIAEVSPDETLVGIGSLIKGDLHRVAGRKVVFGSGSGYGALPRPEQITDWRIDFVRGPLTARLLGLPAKKGVVDGAWLVDQLPALRYKPAVPASGTLFIPHWTTDVFANWRLPCRLAGIEYVTPLQDAKSVFRKIAGAKLAIVESLHGAIMADYYRVPWIPVASDGRVLDFKWLDFCLSLDLPFRPIRLPSTDAIERLLARGARPWDGTLEYLREPRAEDFARARYVDAPPLTAGYRARIKAKSLARGARNAAVGVMNRLRATAPFESRYRPQAERLARLLREIEGAPSYLSQDAARAEKLERLGQIAAGFRAEYGLGEPRS